MMMLCRSVDCFIIIYICLCCFYLFLIALYARARAPFTRSYPPLSAREFKIHVHTPIRPYTVYTPSLHITTTCCIICSMPSAIRPSALSSSSSSSFSASSSQNVLLWFIFLCILFTLTLTQHNRNAIDAVVNFFFSRATLSSA